MARVLVTKRDETALVRYDEEIKLIEAEWRIYASVY